MYKYSGAFVGADWSLEGRLHNGMCDIVCDFFFFQAEDGIRDLTVTGVQTCGLPILGAKMDLHSGIFGGAVANPAAALARLLATLHDSNGHIAVQGFYDDVAPLQQWERDAWKKLPIDPDSEMLEETGAPVLFGEAGFSTLERIWARPTAEIGRAHV